MTPSTISLASTARQIHDRLITAWNARDARLIGAVPATPG